MEKGDGERAHKKPDHEASYEKIPIDLRDRRNAIISLRRPTTRKWSVFATRALRCGCAFIHYDVLSRIGESPAIRLPGLPLVGYYGDSADWARMRAGEGAFCACDRSLATLGIPINPEKFEGIGPIAFSGRPVSLPVPSSRNHLHPPPVLKRGDYRAI